MFFVPWTNFCDVLRKIAIPSVYKCIHSHEKSWWGSPSSSCLYKLGPTKLSETSCTSKQKNWNSQTKQLNFNKTEVHHKQRNSVYPSGLSPIAQLFYCSDSVASFTLPNVLMFLLEAKLTRSSFFLLSIDRKRTVPVRSLIKFVELLFEVTEWSQNLYQECVVGRQCVVGSTSRDM